MVYALSFYLKGSRVDDILCYLTIHSSGQLILLPYGHPQITAPNYDELVCVCVCVCVCVLV